MADPDMLPEVDPIRNEDEGADYKEVVSGTSKALAVVANLCAQKPKNVIVKFNEPDKWFTSISTDRVTEVTVEGVPLTAESVSDCVRLLVLPIVDGAAWPSFQDGKQTFALGRRIVLKKQAPLESQLMEILRGGLSVALVGHPGVGKSTEVNAVLLPLFQSLLDEKNPLKNVFQRVDAVLYRYRVEDGKITCAEVPGAGATLDSMKDFFRRFKDPNAVAAKVLLRNDVVLLLEMLETEQDPRFVHIPTVVAVSTGDAKSVLKTLHKSDALEFKVRPPHTQAELEVLAAALYHGGDKDGLCANLGLSVDSSAAGFSTADISAAHTSTVDAPTASSSTADISWKAVLGKVTERILTIGPVAREVLGKAKRYVAWREEIISTTNVDDFLGSHTSVSAFNLPGPAKYFIAPRADGSIMVLGKLAVNTILTRAEEAHLARIRSIKIEWQLAENIILNHYLLEPQRLLPDGDPAGAGVPGAWNYTKWEYFHNPTGMDSLRREPHLQPTEVAALRAEHTGHRKIELFRGAFPTKTVGDMEKDVVYMSTTHVMSVGEMFTVGESGRLTLYQCSTIDPKEHSFKLRSLQEWIDKVKPTQLSIVYFTDWSERSTSRITIVDESHELDDGDDAVSMALFQKKGCFHSYIVRCGIYNHPSPVMFGCTVMPKFSEWLQNYKDAKKADGMVWPGKDAKKADGMGWTGKFKTRLKGFTKAQLLSMFDGEVTMTPRDRKGRKDEVVDLVVSALEARSSSA